MSSKTLSTRLPDWLERELDSFFREHGFGPSEGLRRVADEWWTMENYPAIEFRDGPAGRRASIRGGPDVWEVVQVAEVEDESRVEAHYDWVDPDHLAQALAYYERFPEQVDRMIQENARLARLMGDPSA